MMTAVFQLQAMSLSLPEIKGGHVNRMPIRGVLTKVGIASDSAPAGSGGKRVLITAEAAERAIPSLLGMGLNLTASLDGHAPTQKIGIIHSAEVAADELIIDAFLYCADFPEQSMRVNMQQAQLGFSFEARNISVEASDADPLIITDLSFTGASILLKDRAAYKTTRLAALAAMAAIEKENTEVTPEELRASLTEVVSAALVPMSAQMTAQQTSLTALEAKFGAFSAQAEANAALVAKVEPAAASLEKTALAIEAAGVGTDAETGQAAILRRMAAAMRADAAAGRIPAPYQMPTGQSHQQQVQQPVAPKFEDSDAYKTLQASLATMTTQLAAAADKQAATETKLADIKASADLQKPAPDRKTLPPQIAHLVAKAGIEMPEGEGTQMNLGKLNQILATSGMSMDQKMTLKTGLAKAGLIPLNTAQ